MSQTLGVLLCPFSTQLGCRWRSAEVEAKISIRREVLYEDGPDGRPRVTGLRMSKAGQEQIVEADAYVAALDVPGAKKLIPQV